MGLRQQTLTRGWRPTTTSCKKGIVCICICMCVYVYVYVYVYVCVYMYMYMYMYMYFLFHRSNLLCVVFLVFPNNSEYGTKIAGFFDNSDQDILFFIHIEG